MDFKESERVHAPIHIYIQAQYYHEEITAQRQPENKTTEHEINGVTINKGSWA
jgi:hypothetical protein